MKIRTDFWNISSHNDFDEGELSCKVKYFLYVGFSKHPSLTTVKATCFERIEILGYSV